MAIYLICTLGVLNVYIQLITFKNFVACGKRFWMKNFAYCFIFLLVSYYSFAQQTPFEKSNGKETATYFEAIAFYKNLDKHSSKLLMKQMGTTDAGHPF